MAKSSGKKVSKKRQKTSRTETGKGKTTRIIHHSTKEIKIERTLIENFIALQKVMVNLSSKFDDLSDQISKLLQLFEISAKSLAAKDIESEKSRGGEKKILEKLDRISEHAGLIGKGLTLIHKVSQEKSPGFEEPEEEEFPVPVKTKKPMPQSPGRSQMKRKLPLPQRKPQPSEEPLPSKGGMQGYQKSISSSSSDENA